MPTPDLSLSSASLSLSNVSRLVSAAGEAVVEERNSKRLMWLVPAVTAASVLLVGWWAQSSVEGSVRSNLAEQLQTLLNADVAALELWLEGEKTDAETIALDDRVRLPILRLVELAAEAGPDGATSQLLLAPELAALKSHLGPWAERQGVAGFVVVDRNGLIVAATLDLGIGDPTLGKEFEPLLQRVFDGETVFGPPITSTLPLPNQEGAPTVGLPVMSMASPVHDDNDEIVAALLLRRRPEGGFTEILRVARAGESGETIAFNTDGVMLTESRFEDELKRIGLLPDNDEASSILGLRIADPGVDMTRGKRPKQRAADRPLTLMAEACLAGDDGVDVNGYHDYRGVPVVGAWTWLPEYEIGIATEVDVAEAYKPLKTLRFAFGLLAALLVAVTVGLASLTYYAERLRAQARRAALQAKRLGQYSLEEKLGSGGMGVVYQAKHDMLHRPTAVKLLDPEKADEQSIARFEREVQLTSRLTHPNTIEIYDYGRTSDGLFYYAMELLDGVTLDTLIKRFGPLPDGRVIYILSQLCGSLAEAHAGGLIHRDVKPANIMLTKCGGMHDFVKLLDFGLVKAAEGDHDVTVAGSLPGSRTYLSPEAIAHQEIDGRSDLYAVGAVSYFMITGTPVFAGKSVLELCQQHTSATPERPSERIGRPVDAVLEEAVLACLAKSPVERPATAEALEERLLGSAAAGSWNRADARDWWKRNLDKPSGEPPTIDVGATATLAGPGPTG